VRKPTQHAYVVISPDTS